MLEASAFEAEIAIEKLKRHISPGIDQISVDLITTGGWPFRSEIHKLNDSILSKQQLPEQWKESIIEPIYKKGGKTGRCNYRNITFVNYIQNFIQHPAVKVKSTSRENYWGLSVSILKKRVN